MNVLVEIEGMDTFKEMTARAADFSKPLFERVVPIVYQVRKEQFDGQGYYANSDSLTPWAPFKKKPKGTSRGEGGRFTTRKLLNKTGRMRRAMTSHSAPATVEAGSDYLVFRSHIDYEQYHQTGTPRMPARPITFDKPSAQAKAQRELIAYIVEPVDPQAAERTRREG